jgi:predicted ATPase/transcriptional regulator with XRE-family HTH domain
MMPDQEDSDHAQPHTLSHTVPRLSATARETSVEKERVTESAFGALLRRHRLAAGVSQETLAERARMSVNGISALERGERRSPYHETVALLTKALRLTPVAAAELEAAAARPRQPHDRVGAGAGTLAGDGRRDATNLPLQRTSLIGRETEIVDIVGILQESRLVTVTGAGGVGKTRTALAVGDALLGDTRAGVWLVELAPLAQGSFVGPAVARALNIQETPNRPLLETLLAYLKQKSLLLILDNCEHVIAEAAALADALLRECPQLRVLATSREPLRIAGEHLYRLPSLSVPTPQEASQLTVTGAADYAAILLFIERAKANDHAFTLSDDTAPIVADICRRLDGLPLAIELAAARLKVLSPRQLRERLEERFRVLTGGSRNALPRQQTIRALIDWSYDLLDERERTLFRRLGIFVNGFTLESAVAVGSGDELDELEVFDVLASLVDKSLVLADFGGERTRYRLLESTREYALEKLIESGERSAFARRHAEWVAAFVKGADDTYWTLPVGRWLAPLEGELDNLRAALHWTIEERGDAVVGARIAGALPNVWYDAGLIREGRRWIDLALATLDEATHPRVVGRLLLAQAHLADGEPRVLAAEDAIRCLESLGDRLRLARAYVILAWGHAEMQSLVPCLAASEGALTLLRSPELAQPALLAAALVVRGEALKELERYSEARTAHGEALSLYLEMGDQRRYERDTIALAELEFAVGQVPAALSLTRAAASRAQEVADVVHEALARANAAAYHLILREIDDAKREARAALTLARSAQRDLYTSIAIQHLATVAVLEGDAERAARLRGYVDARYGVLGFARSRTEQRAYDILMTELRARSSDGRIAQLAEAGARLSDDAAAAEALGVDAAYDERRA